MLDYVLNRYLNWVLGLIYDRESHLKYYLLKFNVIRLVETDLVYYKHI